MSTPALNPLVEKIRAAHPGAYDDMNDAALTKAVLAKYPQYSDLAAPQELQGAKDYKSPSDAASEIADMIGSAAKSLAKVSGPNVMYEVLRKNFPQLGLKSVLGMPTANEVGAAGVGMMIPGAEGESAAEGVAAKAETPSAMVGKAGSMLEHPGVAPWIDAMKAELMKIPGANLAKTVVKSAKGFAEGAEPPPVPTPPAPAIPATNGVPWGTNIPPQGPPELWGKEIPQPAPVPPVPARPDIGKVLNDALGGKPLQPNVPLRQQLSSTPKPNTVPDGFTPVDSSVLKAYKYDSATNEFTAVTKNGQTYTHGEVTPDQVEEFKKADSQGKAWTDIIRNNSPLLRKNGIPVRPSQRSADPSESTSPDNLPQQLQESLRRALALKEAR